MIQRLALLFILLGFNPPAIQAEPLVRHPDEVLKQVAGEIEGAQTIELGALKIQARIYEPTVIYILDRARLDPRFEEQEMEFSQRIFEPIIDDTFR